MFRRNAQSLALSKPSDHTSYLGCYHRAKSCEDDVGKEQLSKALTCKEKDQL